jgi:hypothetical protein
MVWDEPCSQTSPPFGEVTVIVFAAQAEEEEINRRVIIVSDKRNHRQSFDLRCDIFSSFIDGKPRRGARSPNGPVLKPTK